MAAAHRPKRLTGVAKAQQMAIDGLKDGRFTREAVRAMLISSGMKVAEVERQVNHWGNQKAGV